MKQIKKKKRVSQQIPLPAENHRKNLQPIVQLELILTSPEHAQMRCFGGMCRGYGTASAAQETLKRPPITASSCFSTAAPKTTTDHWPIGNGQSDLQTTQITTVLYIPIRKSSPKADQ